MTKDDIIDHILEVEGGYVKDPDDRGGCTKYGITRETLSEWRGYDCSCHEVDVLTEPEARAIYRDRYIERPRFDDLPSRLQPLMVDSGVQHGPDQASKWLQEAAGVKADGVVGPVTLEAVRDANIDGLYRQVLAKRIRYYFAIIANDPPQAKFANGWANRVTRFLES